MNIREISKLNKLRFSLCKLKSYLPKGKGGIYIPSSMVVYKNEKMIMGEKLKGYFEYKIHLNEAVIRQKESIMTLFEKFFVIPNYETWSVVWHEDKGYVALQRLIDTDYKLLSTGLTEDSLNLLNSLMLVRGNDRDISAIVEFMTLCVMLLTVKQDVVENCLEMAMYNMQLKNELKPIVQPKRINETGGIVVIPMIPCKVEKRGKGYCSGEMKNWKCLLRCVDTMDSTGKCVTKLYYIQMADPFQLHILTDGVLGSKNEQFIRILK